MKFATLFTGGKDSTYSTYIAIKCGHEVMALIHMNSKNIDSYMFHVVGRELTTLEAKAMGIPLEEFETSGEKEKELEDLKQALLDVKKKYNIEGIITGALASKYQFERIRKIADELGLATFNPLWKTNIHLYLQNLIKEGFKPIIISVSALGLEKNFVGKVIDEILLEELVRRSEKYGFNLGFEGGEAETAVIDGPIFRKRIVIKEFEIAEDEGRYYMKNIKAELQSK
jgi:ABC transporter with metal-binding/Fe-S-binding domain ATP-binding protein